MTRIWSTVIGSLLVAQGLVTGGRAQNRGINTQTERVLIAVSEMGHSTTSFEKQDDPTIDKNPVPAHEAPRAARKAAENGDHLAKQKKHEEAMAKYREALSIDPLYYEAANNLALELEAAGNTAEAESTFRHLMQSTPEHVLAFTNLAIMLCAAHRYAEAEAVLREAMKRHSYSFKANYLLGAVLVDEGKATDEAKTKLQYAQVRYREAKALLAKWPPDNAAN